MNPELSRLPGDLIAALLDAGLVLDRVTTGGVWREFWEGPHIEAVFAVNGVSESLDRVLDRVLDRE